MSFINNIFLSKINCFIWITVSRLLGWCCVYPCCPGSAWIFYWCCTYFTCSHAWSEYCWPNPSEYDISVAANSDVKLLKYNMLCTYSQYISCRSHRTSTYNGQHLEVVWPFHRLSSPVWLNLQRSPFLSVDSHLKYLHCIHHWSCALGERKESSLTQPSSILCPKECLCSSFTFTQLSTFQCPADLYADAAESCSSSLPAN